ncbi:MAG: hypothetical protein J6X89_05810 [Bacteroidales bacterium]|nr:hypothetical protein [Bacteroidales bacterium]
MMYIKIRPAHDANLSIHGYCQDIESGILHAGEDIEPGTLHSADGVECGTLCAGEDIEPGTLH